MTPVRIFVSYSHRDPEYLGNDSLLGFLRGLEAEEGVEFWTDERLEGGTFWDEEIQKRLTESDIALVLVSQSFLDSRYCTSVEMSTFLARCREDGLIIFPVILSPCEWERYEWLASRQFLPSGDETIEEHYSEPGKRKRLFLKIRQELRSAIARARERVRPDAAADVAAPPPTVQPLAERRQLTLLQCDLAPTERDGGPLDPEELPEILHELAPEFLRVATQVFEPFEGHIAQSSGSSMLVFFGYPVGHEDDSRRAVRAGMALVETIGKLSARFEEELGVRLGVRVGVHSGTVIAPAGAASAEADGEMTTIVSRVQEAAPPNTVMVSEATYRLVENFFETGDAISVALPQSREVDARQILRDTGQHSRVHANADKGLTPMVGRAKELGLLLDRFADARGGSGEVVLLRSEAGIGKSRLLAEVRERTASEKRVWIECRCSPYHRNSSFFPISTSFEAWFQFEPGDDDAAKLAKIERTVERYGPLEQLVPPLATVLSVPADKYAVTASPREQKELMLQVMVQLVVEMASEMPVLFVMEDLHWADPSTVEFLDLLVEHAATVPVLVLLTFRPEYVPPPQWLNHENVSQIALDRLGADAAREMILALSGGKSLPEEVFEEIFAKTEGFPLFIEDLTKMVLESDLVVQREDRYELVGPFHSLAIPDTLQEALMARLAKLATAKPVAQIGATIGREFVFDMLREVGGFDDKVLTEELNRLVQAGLLYRRGLLSRAKYIFKHALVQEALQQSLLKKQRRQYHKLIAAVLEEKFRDVAESQPELVAYHYEESGVPAKAVVYWHRAAQRALAHGANREALSHARRAIEIVRNLPADPKNAERELELRMIEGPVLLALKGWASSELGLCYSRARELCAMLPKSKKLFDTLRGIWSNDMVAARLYQALAAAEELHTMALAAEDDDLRLESRGALCDTLSWLGRPVDSLAQARRGLGLYDFDLHHVKHSVAFGEDPAGMFYTYGCVSLNLLGLRGEAQQLADEAIELLERFSHRHSRAFLLAGIVWHYVERCDADNALRYAQQMIDLAVEEHFEAWNALATFWKGWAIAFAGELEAGIELMADGRRRWHDGGAGVESCWFPAQIAELCLSAGRVDDAQQWVTLGLQRDPTNDDRCYLSELHRLEGEVLLARGGDDSEIAEAFQTALRISAEQKAAVLSLRAATSMARFLRARGRDEEAALFLRSVCDAYRGDDDTPELLAARVLLHRRTEEQVGA